MLRIAICDDRADQLKKIHDACEKYLQAHPEISAQIITFTNPLAFLDKLEQIGGCDIALLDICMPGISGIQVAKEINARQEQTQIVFLAASREYAVDAFAVGAAHYLIKPYTNEDFTSAMDRVTKKYTAAPAKKILINGEGGAIHNVDVNDIIYIESFRNGRSVHTTRQNYTETKRTLRVLLEELVTLSPMQFVSPYRGYIINLDAVKSISTEGITLKNGVSIPIKPGGFRALRDSYFDYEFRKEG